MTKKIPFALFLAVALTVTSAVPVFAQNSSLKALKEREEKVIEVVRNSIGATVAIEGVTRPASGSGVIVNKEGLILTAAHVTAAAGQRLNVTFPDGRTVSAKSLGANSSRDAGMAQITEEGDWPFVELGKAEDVELGQWCVALGHPEGYDPNRPPPVRLGRVWTKRFGGMLGTDCTLVGGDSGGPLFDLDGKLIGIHSSIGGQLSQNRHVPMNAYTKDWDDLVGGKLWGNQGVMTGEIDPDRPAMGIQLDRSYADGVKVSGLSDPSPAGDAGIEVGDVVRKIGKRKVANYEEMRDVMEKFKAGQTVKITVDRGDKELEFDVKLGRLGKLWNMDREPEQQEPRARPTLGVNLLQDAERAEIYDVVPGSAADKGGIEPGDVVLEIDGIRISSGAEMALNIRTRKPGDEITLLLLRGEDEKKLKVTLGRAE